jgi:hypothetical protein
MQGLSLDHLCKSLIWPLASASLVILPTLSPFTDCCPRFWKSHVFHCSHHTGQYAPSSVFFPHWWHLMAWSSMLFPREHFAPLFGSNAPTNFSHSTRCLSCNYLILNGALNFCFPARIKIPRDFKPSMWHSVLHIVHLQYIFFEWM